MPPAKNSQITEGNLPVAHRIDGLKPLKQLHNACVPTSAAMVFAFYGKELDKEVIADWIQKAYGSNPRDLEQFVQIQKFSYYTSRDWSPERKKIKYFLSQDYPVIVAGKLGLGLIQHMIVLIGYDDRQSGVWQGKTYQGIFFVLDPAIGKEVKINLAQFKEFHLGGDNYFLVIYKPAI